MLERTLRYWAESQGIGDVLAMLMMLALGVITLVVGLNRVKPIDSTAGLLAAGAGALLLVRGCCCDVVSVTLHSLWTEYVSSGSGGSSFVQLIMQLLATLPFLLVVIALARLGGAAKKMKTDAVPTTGPPPGY